MLRVDEDLEPILERTKGYVDSVVTHSGHYSCGMATLRNELLAKAKVGLDGGDYLLLLDPDEIPSDSFPGVELTAAVYDATYIGGGDSWNKPTLLRVDEPATFKRSVHEYLDTPTRAILLEGYSVEQPFSSSSHERQMWKVEQLLQEQDDSRSVYYLAQTYDCLGMKGESFRYYLVRSTMGGYEEERWHAVYRAACLAESFDYSIAMTLFERCIEERPGRPEGYYRLARLVDYFGQPQRAHQLIGDGAAIPISNDNLFVNRWMESELRLRAALPVGHVFDEVHE